MNRSPGFTIYLLQKSLTALKCKQMISGADPAISTVSANLTTNKGSGYDRSRLCPAADMKLNHISMSETFFLSNMSGNYSPQIEMALAHINRKRA